MTTKDARELDHRLSDILRKWVTPILKPIGFKKANLAYVSDRGPLSWYLNIQRSRWNSQEKLEFTINCGVFVPGVVSTWTNHPPKKSVTLTKCSIYVRIGTLAEKKIDQWWELHTSDNTDIVDRTIGEELQKLIQEYGLVFLRNFNTLAEVAEFLVALPKRGRQDYFPIGISARLAYAAIIYSQLGNNEKQRELMDEAVRMVTGSSIDYLEDHMITLRERLSGGS